MGRVNSSASLVGSDKHLVLNYLSALLLNRLDYTNGKPLKPAGTAARWWPTLHPALTHTHNHTECTYMYLCT